MSTCLGPGWAPGMGGGKVSELGPARPAASRAFSTITFQKHFLPPAHPQGTLAPCFLPRPAYGSAITQLRSPGPQGWTPSPLRTLGLPGSTQKGFSVISEVLGKVCIGSPIPLAMVVTFNVEGPSVDICGENRHLQRTRDPLGSVPVRVRLLP